MFDESAFSHFTPGLIELYLRIHHDWAAPGDGFFDGFAGNQQKSATVVSRFDADGIALIEENQRSVAEKPR